MLHVCVDLCQYNGVKFVKNPDNKKCGYLACWKKQAVPLSCPVGSKVAPNFFWSETYPCTDADVTNDCDNLSR